MNETLSSHTVIHLAIDARDALTLPVVVVFEDPERPTISICTARYARYLQREGLCSYEKIYKTVTAIGKLHDYYLLVRNKGALLPEELRGLLEDFLFSIDHGAVLGWRPASNQTYRQIRSAIFEFIKFVIDNSNIEWPADELHFIDSCRKSWKSTTHAEKSLLFHTKKRAGKKARGRKRIVTGLRDYKPFPPHMVIPLIEHTKNIRDKLLFGLMAFGGRRLSEILHLFVNDIESKGNKLRVALRHPIHSPMAWVTQSGARTKGARREYLRSIFNRLPRTEHGALPSASGWKGMKFDDEARMSSEMYFIREVENFLLTLHRAYLYETRSKVERLPHPYYFVNLNGQPLTIRAVEKQFHLACKRLTKKYGNSLSGYGPHSLRHYYGFYCADVLEADLLLIQKWMGHTHPSSTVVYTHISPGTAAKHLAEAEQRAKLEGRITLSPTERDAIRKTFSVCSMDAIPDSWKLDRTKFGIFSPNNLCRPLK